MDRPFISIIIPCRNEEDYISICIKSLLSNDYQENRMEILVIDGGSTDRTIEMVHDIAVAHPCIKFFKNHFRVFPSAVNIGIKAASGDLIFIAGAHAVYDPSYLVSCAELSLKYDADNVGGVLETLPVSETFIGRIVTRVLTNPFGVGGSKFRTGVPGITETDTVFGGCYKRNVFEKYGLFNEKLISTSDYEFNKRIKRGGAKILLDPAIKTKYYTRSSLTKFIRNNIRNGYWAIYPIVLTDHFPVSLRHLIPLIFLLSLLSLGLLSFISSVFLMILLAISGFYFFAAYYFTFRESLKNLGTSLLMPGFFLLLHLSYGMGSLFGLLMVVKEKLLSN